MKYKKERFFSSIAFVSSIITIVMWVCSASQIFQGIAIGVTLILFILFFYCSYCDIKKIFNEKEEELSINIDEIQSHLRDLKDSTKDFCSTCDKTRGKVIECHEEVISKLDMPSRVEFDIKKVKKQLQDMLDEAPHNSLLRIICYGRNGYGYIVRYIADNKIDVQVEFIVCMAGEYNLTKGDIKDIEDQIYYMKSNNFKVYASSVPPSIRAAALYSPGANNKLIPIWCSFQSYKLGKIDNGNLSVICPEHYPINVETKNSDQKNLDNLIAVFENEYKYLFKHSMEAYIKGVNEIGYTEINENEKEKNIFYSA